MMDEPTDLPEGAEVEVRLVTEPNGKDLPAILANAPYDDEPVTADEEAAVAEAVEDEAHGRVVPHDEVRREFGL